MSPNTVATPIDLLVMDVDSTFLNEEVIDLVAAHAGIGDEVARITERAMAGELDFTASLAERVALLAGLPVAALDEVRRAVTLTNGAADLVAAVQAGGGVVALVSGGFTEVIAPLAAELGISEVHANGFEIRDEPGREQSLSGRTRGPIIDPGAKRTIFVSLREKYDCDPARTVAVGDGANDIGMITEAALGIAFCAKPALVAAADAALDVRDLRGVLDLWAAHSAKI